MGTIRPILHVLLPMALGACLRAVGLFGQREGELLRKFVVRFALPLFIFFSLYQAEAQSLAAMAPMVAAFVLMTGIMFLLGWTAAMPFEDVGRRTAVHACVTFGNWGWMGLGVVGALLGAGGTQRVVYFTMFWWPVFYGFGLPVGLIHARRSRKGVPLRSTLAVAAPPLAAMGLGLALNLTGVRVPKLAVEVLRPFAGMTVPLILLSVGMLLDARRIGGTFWPVAAVCGATLVIGPLVGLGLAGILAPDQVTYGVIILEGAMPVATLVPILEENFKMDVEVVSTAILASTVLSMVTLPIVATLVLAAA